MCDCFHLPFPNWHGSPGTGAGRRLKGPEPEDDSVCEDAPEFLEGERPRPQGSSPVNEYPATEKYTDLDKEGEEELYDPYQKGSGNKKGKKVGFGSFFEKRSKMSQEECPESGVIVKTPKEVCAKGLVVSGGGKEGIFIKEVKAESPAAKHLSAQEGDQILSATVYFDNVSYEDALQILEHAQPYKMEFCLKRKPLTASDLESSTAERQEIAPGEEGISQLERGRTKTQRRQDARISWPKFPSFTRGRKAHFKRSHSTSEAEEQRKLEMSPPTSDTESPMKSQELGKDKKTKKQKVKLSKMKMKGVKSKSVEEETDSIPVSRSLENVQPQQAVHVLDAHSPPPQGSLLGETAQIYVIDQQEKKETTKIKNECHFADVSGSVAQTSQHRVDLISLDKTLKTTDISDFLADRGSSSTKKSPDVKKKKKKERSELKVNIQGKEKEDLSPEGLLKSPQTLILKTSSDSLKTPDMGARAQDLSSNTVGPNVISHPELKGYPIAIDINAESIDPNKSIPQVDKESSAEKVISTTAWMGDADICLPKVDMSLDMSDVGLLKKSPMVKSEKPKKDRSILIRDSERYGIRPRGPMADIGMTKKYLGQGSSVDSDSDISKPKSPKMKTSFPGVKGQEITANRKDASIKMETVLDIQSPQFEIQASKSPKETNIDETEKTGTKTVPKFKMPKIEVPDFKVHDPIVMTEVKASKSQVDVKDPKVEHRMHKTELHSTQPSTTKQVDIKIELLKREDIEIPGMEATALSGNLQTIGFKLPETGKIDASVPVVGIHAKKFQGDMKVHGIKDTTSKTDLQTFKLPKVDISSLDVHQQITKSDVTAEKVKLDLTADVFQPKTPEMDVKGQGLKIKASDHSTGIGINDINGEIIKRSIPTHKVPKIDSPDPDAHEPITMKQVSSSKTKVGSKIQQKLPMGALDDGMLEISSSHFKMDKMEKPEKKLPKREDIEIPGMESILTAGNIQTIDIQSPGIGKQDASATSVEIQAMQIDRPTFKLPKMDSDFDVHEQITKRDVNTEMSKSPKQHKKDQIFPDESKKGKFKIPPVPQYDASFPNLKSDVKLTEERETGEMKCISDTEIKISARTDINADFKSPSTEMSQNKEMKLEVELGAATTDQKESEKKSKKTKVSMPTFGIAKPDIRFPDAGVQISLSKGKDEVKLAKACEIETENLSRDTSLSPVKTPMFEKPDLDIKGPIISDKEPSLHMKLPELEQTVSGKMASFDIKGPNVAVEEPAIDINVASKIIDLAGQESKSKSGISLSNVKGPRVDINISKPDNDFPHSEASVKVESPIVQVEKSSVEGKLQRADIPIKGVDLTMDDAKIPVPKIGTSRAEAVVSVTKQDIKEPQVVVKGPYLKDKLDISLKETKDTLPHMDIPPLETSKPDMKELETQSGKVGVKVPGIYIKEQTIEIDKSKDKIELPELKMPDINVAPPKIILKSTQTETKPFISKPIMDVKTPEVHIKPPSLEIKAGERKERQLYKEIPKAEVELSVPQTDAVVKESTVEGQSLDRQAEIPDIEMAKHGKFKMPHVKLPSFGFSKPEVKGDNISGDVHLPTVDVAVTKPDREFNVPDISADVTSVGVKLPEADLAVSGKPPAVDIKGYSMDVEGPELDIDMKVKGSELEGQGSKFKLPKFGISLPKVKGPAMDITVSKPDVDISLPRVTAEVKLPGVEVEGPSVEGTVDIPEGDSKDVDIKLKKPKMSLPKFGFSKPEITAPKISGNLNLPSVDIAVTKPDADINVPDISADVTSVGVKLPEADLAVSGKPPAVDIKGYSMDVEAPEVDIDMKVKGTELEGQGSKFKLPKFGISLPKAKGPAMDITVSKPDVDISLPQVTAEAKLPGVEVEGSSLKGQS
ncbi:protein AHNAK2-like [Anguilla rostrata]